MTNILQQSIFAKMRLRAASATLTLAVVLVLGIVTTHSAQAQNFTLLHSFTGSPDGAFPDAGLVRDAVGNLYSTTEGGGASNWGTVFEVDTSGGETRLFNFSYSKGSGAAPSGDLVRDSAGNLYGTTNYGGSSGNGVVFKVNSSGKETVLHNFAGGTKDGCRPFLEGLVRDAAGNLYGTTESCGAFGYGTVFMLSKSGNLTLLHSFTGGTTDGCYPYAGLVRDRAGNLYSTTRNCGSSGNGVVFKVNSSGKETVLHNFAGGTKDGCQPFAGLIRDSAGNLYGTTTTCGSSFNGTVFKVDTSGKETVLYSFTGAAGGAFPTAGLVRDTAGNLYGTTSAGGSSGNGTVFKLSKSGKETVLHNFAGGTGDGCNPYARLVRDSAGNLYGTTLSCGSSNDGTVWKLTP